MQKNNRKKRNNKGFSMVELIIVIAIMAALVGILAPQYIKYVAKSKDAADKAQMDEILKAAKVIATEDNMNGKEFTIRVNNALTGTPATAVKVTTTVAADATLVETHLSNILGTGYATKKLNNINYQVVVTWPAGEPLFTESNPS